MQVQLFDVNKTCCSLRNRQQYYVNGYYATLVLHKFHVNLEFILPVIEYTCTRKVSGNNSVTLRLILWV